jgi:hypothetical protein
VKVLGLLPIRNEAWVLRHTLSCLSGFCDTIIVNDQNSEDDSRSICEEFPKVELLPNHARDDCDQSRWRLLDAARDYAGNNLLWFNDADELVSARWMSEFLGGLPGELEPGTVLECTFYNLWGTAKSYRDDFSPYRPHSKSMAFVDDRTADYDRTPGVPLHVPRVPILSPSRTLRAERIRVFHLQWLIPKRNQVKQAWYRCREWLGKEKTSAEINALYSITLDAPRARTTPVPLEWLDGVTFPDLSVDDESSWHEREIFRWFHQHGVEHFEPLEIWHIDALRDEFRLRTGRRPRPDRSYRPPWTAEVRRFARRATGAVRRRAGL